MAHKQTITCSECGAENPADRLFCARCGAYLSGAYSSEHIQTGPPPLGNQPRPRRTRRRSALGPVLLVVLLAAVGLTVLLIHQQYQELEASSSSVSLASTTSSTSSVSSTGQTTSTTTKTTTAGQARVFPSSCKASSFLPATDEYTYGPENLSDNNLSTAWNEGASGDGVGEWVSFSFSSPVQLTRIDIANGYQRDQRRFLGNERIQALRIEYSSGKSQEVQLHDDMGYQEVQTAVVANEDVSSVRLTILSVYPGESWEDAALSEVRFIGTRQ